MAATPLLSQQQHHNKVVTMNVPANFPADLPAEFEVPPGMIERQQQDLVEGRAALAMYPWPRPFPPRGQPWVPLPGTPPPPSPELPPELGDFDEAFGSYLSGLPPSPSASPPPPPPPPAAAAPPPAQQPLPAPPPPVVNGNPLWAWLAQEAPNATGTYYSYSARPGGVNRALNKSGPGMMVYTPQMVNQACEQKAEVTLSHQGNTRLNAMIAAIGARPGIIVPPGLTSNRLKARWIISQERSFRSLGVGVAVPPGFASGPVMPTSYFAGRISGGVLAVDASTAYVVEFGPA